MLENFSSDTLLLGLTWYVVFLFSTTCHEAAHALAAKLGGDLTAFHSGQVTLDPRPHIRREPFGMVLFPILTFLVGGWMMGWASAPYDPLWAQRHPRRAAWMSLAGPAANFVLVVLSGIAMRIAIQFHLLKGDTGTIEGISTLLGIMFSLNLLLCVFNLLPLPPLDGFSAIGLLLPESAAESLQSLGMRMRGFSMFGLLIAWRIFDPIFEPIHQRALRLLYLGLGS